ncbi:YitT family protein [Nesterenkonia sp. NBAIMH1]|uniref:YitT family protein n=1 Tax=Nesterenkonia sp. NBAIMH1 TaxID=2600320 RepID=UPI0011B3A8CE|nr:YitT family protein [Nesterenkonia sp. NBAIMH1]
MSSAPTSQSPAADVPVRPPTSAPRHSAVENILGILTGCFVVSLGLFLLKSCQAVTGGTAGLALLVSYAVDVPFGIIFIAVNSPFFVLAVWKKGWDFTLRTIGAVVLVSVLEPVHSAVIGEITIAPLYGVLGGNLLTGVGLLILFRHKASLGGFNILVLILQERFNWRAGYVQMGLDVTIVLAALTVVSPMMVVLSALGAAVMNLTLALNHRSGRYLVS